MNVVVKISLMLALSSFLVDASELKKEASVSFVEGPAWRSDGIVFFTDIPNNRIMKKGPAGRLEVHRTPSGHANGLYFDSLDRLLIAEDEGRLVREHTDGTIEVLATSFNGNSFNSINDIALDTKGRIYFTDPAYKNRNKASQRDEDGKVIDGVYRLDPNGKLVRLLGQEVQRPNGIVISPNDEFLYLADSHGQDLQGSRQILRFSLNDAGDIIKGSKEIIYDWGTDRGPDGMTIDVDGNLYVAAGTNTPTKTKTSLIYKAGIYVISPQGVLLDFIPVPMDAVTNVTFGGANNKTLYITAGHSLWTYKVGRTGYLPFKN